MAGQLYRIRRRCPNCSGELNFVATKPMLALVRRAPAGLELLVVQCKWWHEGAVCGEGVTVCAGDVQEARPVSLHSDG